MTAKKTTRKAPARKTTRKAAPKAPPAPKHVVTHLDGRRVLVEPVEGATAPELVRLLLAAAGDAPEAVQVTTGPAGWLVPTSVAKKAGLAV